MYILGSIIVIAVLVAIDQIIKYWAVNTLESIGTMSFIHFGKQKVIDLTYLENDGAVFGSFSGKRIMLIIITAAFLLFCAYLLYKNKNSSKLFCFSLNLVIAGGIGNLIDRIFRGGRVVDYIEIKLFNFAIFNFADICVTVGVAILAICILFIDKSKVTPEKVEADAS